MLRLKNCSNFLFFSNLIWGCSKCVQIALFASWKLLELLYIGFEHKLRTVLSSASVQNLNRAVPATSRTQIEQIRTHLEQPQIKFKTKWKIWTLFEPQLKKIKCMLKIKERVQKNLNIRRLMSYLRPLKLHQFQAIIIWWHSPFKMRSENSRGRWISFWLAMISS